MPEARTKNHPYFARENHVKLAKSDTTKREILDSGLARLPNAVPIDPTLTLGGEPLTLGGEALTIGA